MPIQAGDLQIVGVGASALVARGNHQQNHDADSHVRQVQAGDGEEGGAEQVIAPGILEQPYPFINQSKPLSQVQAGKNDAAKAR